MLTDHTEKDDVSTDVTVVIPAYNAAAHIGRSLKSLAHQQPYSPRVVVVDDGSIDGTADTVQAMACELGLPVEILIQRNKGVSEARNAGLEMASTEYVMFLDADDHVEADCINDLRKAADEASSDMAFCGFDRVDQEGRVIWEYTHSYCYPSQVGSGESVLRSILALKTYIRMGAGLYRRDFLHRYNLRFTRGCTAGEDEEFVLKALVRASEVACVPQILHHYSVTPGSLSRTRTMRRFDWVSALRRVRRYMERAGVSADTAEVMDEFYLPRVVAAMVREVSSAYLPYRDAVRLCKNPSIRRMVEPAIRTDLKSVRQLRVQRLKSTGIVHLPCLFVLAARAYGFLRQ